MLTETSQSKFQKQFAFHKSRSSAHKSFSRPALATQGYGVVVVIQYNAAVCVLQYQVNLVLGFLMCLQKPDLNLRISLNLTGQWCTCIVGNSRGCLFCHIYQFGSYKSTDWMRKCSTNRCSDKQMIPKKAELEMMSIFFSGWYKEASLCSRKA